METTDYCSYELSKALKACGFDEPCLTFYDTNKELGRALDPDNFNYLGETYKREWFTDAISAPTLWQAQKWLRSKGIDIEPHMELVGAKRKYRLVLLPLGHEVSYGKLHPSYEEALEAGIEAALIIIKFDNKKTTGDTRNENRFN
ncbi:hypothetical protein [uncultured Muribaculum sp.]|uniref:hypothetical protein n=1 Tax=uncultured Muribaculum sp. TaxID=1918613 RepID=UPI0025B1603C|nr:hypothetical protein [uncultured Muribaculum sp.]